MFLEEYPRYYYDDLNYSIDSKNISVLYNNFSANSSIDMSNKSLYINKYIKYKYNKTNILERRSYLQDMPNYIKDLAHNITNKIFSKYSNIDNSKNIFPNTNNQINNDNNDTLYKEVEKNNKFNLILNYKDTNNKKAITTKEKNVYNKNIIGKSTLTKLEDDLIINSRNKNNISQKTGSKIHSLLNSYNTIYNNEDENKADTNYLNNQNKDDEKLRNTLVEDLKKIKDEKFKNPIINKYESNSNIINNIKIKETDYNIVKNHIKLDQLKTLNKNDLDSINCEKKDTENYLTNINNINEESNDECSFEVNNDNNNKEIICQDKNNLINNVNFEKNYKKNEIDLCELNNFNAYDNTIPCIKYSNDLIINDNNILNLSHKLNSSKLNKQLSCLKSNQNIYKSYEKLNNTDIDVYKKNSRNLSYRSTNSINKNKLEQYISENLLKKKNNNNNNQNTEDNIKYNNLSNNSYIKSNYPKKFSYINIKKSSKSSRINPYMKTLYFDEIHLSKQKIRNKSLCICNNIIAFDNNKDSYINIKYNKHVEINLFDKPNILTNSINNNTQYIQSNELSYDELIYNNKNKKTSKNLIILQNKTTPNKMLYNSIKTKLKNLINKVCPKIFIRYKFNKLLTIQRLLKINENNNIKLYILKKIILKFNDKIIKNNLTKYLTNYNIKYKNLLYISSNKLLAALKKIILYRDYLNNKHILLNKFKNYYSSIKFLNKKESYNFSNSIIISNINNEKKNSNKFVLSYSFSNKISYHDDKLSNKNLFLNKTHPAILCNLSNKKITSKINNNFNSLNNLNTANKLTNNNHKIANSKKYFLNTSGKSFKKIRNSSKLLISNKINIKSEHINKTDLNKLSSKLELKNNIANLNKDLINFTNNFEKEVNLSVCSKISNKCSNNARLEKSNNNIFILKKSDNNLPIHSNYITNTKNNNSNYEYLSSNIVNNISKKDINNNFNKKHLFYYNKSKSISVNTIRFDSYKKLILNNIDRNTKRSNSCHFYKIISKYYVKTKDEKNNNEDIDKNNSNNYEQLLVNNLNSYNNSNVTKKIKDNLAEDYKTISDTKLEIKINNKNDFLIKTNSLKDNTKNNLSSFAVNKDYVKNSIDNSSDSSLKKNKKSIRSYEKSSILSRNSSITKNNIQSNKSNVLSKKSNVKSSIFHKNLVLNNKINSLKNKFNINNSFKESLNFSVNSVNSISKQKEISSNSLYLKKRSFNENEYILKNNNNINKINLHAYNNIDNKADIHEKIKFNIIKNKTFFIKIKHLFESYYDKNISKLKIMNILNILKSNKIASKKLLYLLSIIRRKDSNIKKNYAKYIIKFYNTASYLSSNLSKLQFNNFYKIITNKWKLQKQFQLKVFKSIIINITKYNVINKLYVRLNKYIFNKFKIRLLKIVKFKKVKSILKSIIALKQIKQNKMSKNLKFKFWKSLNNLSYSILNNNQSKNQKDLKSKKIELIKNSKTVNKIKKPVNNNLLLSCFNDKNRENIFTKNNNTMSKNNVNNIENNQIKKDILNILYFNELQKNNIPKIYDKRNNFLNNDLKVIINNIENNNKFVSLNLNNKHVNKSTNTQNKVSLNLLKVPVHASDFVNKVNNNNFPSDKEFFQSNLTNNKNEEDLKILEFKNTFNSKELNKLNFVNIINKSKAITSSKNFITDKFNYKKTNSNVSLDIAKSIINDYNNPYSTFWGQKILNNRYGMKLAVNPQNAHSLCNLKLVKANKNKNILNCSNDENSNNNKLNFKNKCKIKINSISPSKSTNKKVVNVNLNVNFNLNNYPVIIKKEINSKNTKKQVGVKKIKITRSSKKLNFPKLY